MFIYVYICVCVSVCVYSLCNGYRHRKMDTVTRVQIQDDTAFYIWKLFSLQLWPVQTGLFNLCIPTGLKRKNWIQSCWIKFKIDILSHPACAEGLVNMYMHVCVCVCVCVYALTNVLIWIIIATSGCRLTWFVTYIAWIVSSTDFYIHKWNKGNLIREPLQLNIIQWITDVWKWWLLFCACPYLVD